MVYKLGEPREYYEDLQNTETKLAEDALARYATLLEQQDAELEDIQRKNDDLEDQINEGFSNIQNRIDVASDVLLQAQHNNQKLAIRREKVAAKEQILEATKDELEELDKQMLQAYETLKMKCTLEEDDDQWYKWGKIRRWGYFLNTMVESRLALQADGIYSTSSVTPDIAYADLNSQLTVYRTYHPESTPYVASSKQFFREVSKGKREYAGVVIFAFKDDASHPFFKLGDIVVGYDGKTIKSYDDFSAAFKANAQGVVTYLRLVEGRFEECQDQLEATDIIGFLDLTE